MCIRDRTWNDPLETTQLIFIAKLTFVSQIQRLSVFWAQFSIFCLIELLPVTILILKVTLFNIHFTNEWIHTLCSVHWYDANGFVISMSNTIQGFISAYHAAVVWNLQFSFFIWNNSVTFCLWERATTLDILAFKYVAYIHSLLLVLLTVCIFDKILHLL